MNPEVDRPEPGPGRPAEPEPAKDGSAAAREPGGVFAVLEHHTGRRHWSLLLERRRTLVSWAVPKGMPDDPAHDRLAVHTGDRPLEPGVLSGEAAPGEPGAGTVSVWDRGSYDLVEWEPGGVKVVLHGRRLAGGYALFRTRRGDWMIHRERVPMPQWLPPMMAVGDDLPDSDEGWAYEMKWDGVRVSAYLSGGRLLRLMSRTGRDVTATYPELRALGGATAPRQLVLDGEIVAFADGKPSFEALQPRMHVASPAQAARLARQVPVTCFLFDLLHVDGRPTVELPYSKRRELLDDLGLAGPSWQTPPSFAGLPGAAMMQVAADQGLEGVVAKRLDSPYRPGVRSAEWRKVKRVHRQETVVGGISPGKGNRAGRIGSLLAGVMDSGGLVYAGRVGTGFTDQTLRMLGERLMPLRRDTSPFATPVPPDQARGAIWVEPRVVIEVEFTGWTKEGRLRAASYQGLRTDKDPAEVVREP